MENNENESEFTPLTWHKWFVNEYEAFKEALTAEEMGELFFSVMETVKTGKRVEVKDKIRIPYAMYLNTLKSTQKAYINKCKKNAENGSKGGRAKANNQKQKSISEPYENKSNNIADEDMKAKDEKKYLPPQNYCEFRNIANRIYHERENFYCNLEYDEDLLEIRYKDLQEANWSVQLTNGRELCVDTSRALEIVIFAVLSKTTRNYCWPYLYYSRIGGTYIDLDNAIRDYESENTELKFSHWLCKNYR